ncbi:hypothetical protein AHAS_Ahas18G0240100 [Arachis hypogaea]
MEIAPSDQEGVEITPKISYRDSLLSLFGIDINIVNEPIAITDEDEFDPEDRWYKDEIGSLKKEKPFNPCSVISVTQEEFVEWCKPWKATLIVRVLGKRVGLGFMEQRLKRDWTRKGSTIGSMLKIDRTMSIHSRGKFARIFVEINLSKQLVLRISVLESILNIEYKGLHIICFRCRKYSHKSEVCSKMLDSNKNHHVEDTRRGGSVNQNISQATGGPHHELRKSGKVP